MRAVGFSLALISACMSMAPGVAQAQATRTWVSGVGDDANPCSRTAPCKTFAGAISKTAAGGEINCLDPGGFGAVTITKAMAIICDYTEGGVTAPGTTAITVNAASTDNIFLSGLDLEGIITGLNGINFIAGGSLHVQWCKIRGFTSAGNGNGILFQPSGASKLFVSDTVIADNGGEGIEVRPTGAGSAQVQLDRVRAENNVTGFRGNGTTTTGSIMMNIEDSIASGNSSVGINATTPVAGGQTTQVIVDRTSASNNATYAVRADGAGATVWVGNSTFTGNGSALGTLTTNHSAIINSYGTNAINGNALDTPYPTPAGLH